MRACVVGGGAAGMMAAIRLAENGVDVVVLERNEKLGKKLYITGKGRCNLTNDCSGDALFDNIVRGGKFLTSALSAFSPQDAMAFFEGLGLQLTVERGNRVFPKSGKSSDVIKALKNRLQALCVAVKLNTTVKNISKTADGFELECASSESATAPKRNQNAQNSTSPKGEISEKGDSNKTSNGSYFIEKCDVVIVATGGVSYPSTGSTGDGYKFAKQFGMPVCPPRPSLVALNTVQSVRQLAGITLKNVRLTASCNGKSFDEFGELTFTDSGISGPLALTMSSYLARENLSAARLSLDLKPALDVDTLDARLVRDFQERQNQPLCSAIRGALIDKLNIYVLQRAKVDPFKKVNALTKDERGRIVSAMKSLDFNIKSAASFNEAVITSGGVQLDSLKPTLESRSISGLYFIGEVIDADALTGGFNLQIAWATGVRAADDIAYKLRSFVK